MKRTKQNDEIDQVFCLTGDQGHVWIHAYDALRPVVRRRLRTSRYNLCAACLTTYVLPEIRRKHPNLSREKLLFAAIESMELEVYKGDKK
jgi:hypothetical protein